MSLRLCYNLAIMKHWPEDVYTDAPGLADATREACSGHVEESFGLVWTDELGTLIKNLLTTGQPGALARLRDVILEIRQLAERGKWFLPGDEIVFRVRVGGGDSARDPELKMIGKMAPRGLAEVASMMADADQRPLMVLVDDERWPEPKEPRNQTSVRPLSSDTLPDDPLRDRLVAQFAKRSPDLAALFILLQPLAYFADKPNRGHATRRESTRPKLTRYARPTGALSGRGERPEGRRNGTEIGFAVPKYPG